MEGKEDMAEEGFFHATGGGGGLEVIGGGMGTFGTTESEDEKFDRGRISKFGCDTGHRGFLSELASDGLDG